MDSDLNAIQVGDFGQVPAHELDTHALDGAEQVAWSVPCKAGERGHALAMASRKRPDIAGQTKNAPATCFRRSPGRFRWCGR